MNKCDLVNELREEYNYTSQPELVAVFVLQIVANLFAFALNLWIICVSCKPGLITGIYKVGYLF